jgi:hypothetical protein
MSSVRLVARLAAGLAVAALLLVPPARLEGRPAVVRPSCSGAQAVAEGQPCCFTNPQYTGKCVVQPGAGETCASILDYLNNPQAQGKSYCGNTTVRGGWAQADCGEKKSEPVPQDAERR